MVVAPQQPALPGHGGEEGDVVALPEHGHAVERGEQREGDGLEVAILAGEQRDAAADGEAEQVGRHPRHTCDAPPHITSRHITSHINTDTSNQAIIRTWSRLISSYCYTQREMRLVAAAPR